MRKKVYCRAAFCSGVSSVSACSITLVSGRNKFVELQFISLLHEKGEERRHVIMKYNS